MSPDPQSRKLVKSEGGNGSTKRSHGLALYYAAAAAIVLVFFAYFQTQIWDSDFWWHLASGRWIVETQSVPGTDPFLVYDAPGHRNDTMLKGYWLGQAAMYLVVRTFGLNGIIVLKSLVLASALSILFLRLRLANVPFITRLLVLAIAGMALLPFTGERPQLFSFLFSSLVFLLFEKHRTGEGRVWLFCIPPVMLVWANMHGAAILGAVLLAIQAAFSRAEPPVSRNPSQRERFLIAFIVGASLLMTVATPSGVNTYLSLLQFEGTDLQGRFSEYTSPFRYWRQMLPYIALLVLSVVAVPRLIRMRLFGSLAVMAILAILSISAARYVPFFVLVAGPFAARGGDRLPAGSRMLFAGMLVLALIALTAGLYQDKVFQRGVAAGRFPEAAVRRIISAGLHGKMFNHLDWGGYLLWYSSPAVRTVIDGRVLDFNALTAYTHILWATAEGLRLFEAGKFDFVLLPPGNRFTGEVYPLHTYLLGRPEWHVLPHLDSAGTFYYRGAINP